MCWQVNTTHNGHTYYGEHASRRPLKRVAKRPKIGQNELRGIGIDPDADSDGEGASDGQHITKRKPHPKRLWDEDDFYKKPSLDEREWQDRWERALRPARPRGH